MSLRLYRIFLVLSLICVPALSFAGNVLKGKVTDTKGVTLPGAIIEITDLKTGAAADTDGSYRISNLPNGNYIVEVHELGYETITTLVSLQSKDVVHDFVMKESVIEKNEVVVTGSSLATEERKSITPIQSVSIKDMHENISSNVIDAIASLPGVSAITTGPSVSKPVIRGLSYNRIITLNDGVRQEGQQWGDEHGIEIDDYDVTRIEVLKGPASLAYGSDALAGVINIISNPEIPEGKIVGNITSNYQTNAGMEALHADIGGNNDGISWKVYGTQKQAHDYWNKYDGYVFDTRFHNTDYGASVGVNKSWGSSRLSFTAFNEKTGIPEGTRDSLTGGFVKDVANNGIDQVMPVTTLDGHSYSMTVPYQHIQHYKVVLDNDIYLGNGGRIGITLGYQKNMRMEFGDVVTPNYADLNLLLQTATYDIKYFMPNKKGWQVSAGLNGMSQWNTNNGDEYLVPDYKLFDGGLYAMGKKDFGKWTVSGGLRYDFRVLSTYQRYEYVGYNPSGIVLTYPTNVPYEVFRPFTDIFTSVSGSFGAGYNLNKHTFLKMNLASGYRCPNIAELGANGVHDGTVRYEYGTPSLTPENSLQADLGVSWSREHFLLNVSVFENYIRNYIYIRKLLNVDGRDSIPAFNNPQSYTAYIYNHGNANLYGGEVYCDFHPHPFEWLHLENTFSYVRGLLMQSVDGTNNLPYMPPPRWLIDLRAQKRTLGKYLKAAYAKVGVDINWAQKNVFTAYNTETPVNGYTLVNAGIGADVVNHKHNTMFTLTLAGQNLTNVAYQNALSRLRYTDENYVTGRMGIFNMGRNYSIILSIPINAK
jgi:iron complex outermembrane recepter protein